MSNLMLTGIRLEFMSILLTSLTSMGMSTTGRASRRMTSLKVRSEGHQKFTMCDGIQALRSSANLQAIVGG